MEKTIQRRSFTIKNNNSHYLNKYNNKSKFVNEALSFYISYIEEVKNYKNKFLEDKINEALNGDFYRIDINNNTKSTNSPKYINHSKKLEKNILLAINEE